jgi:hypothetical protein
MNNTAKTRSTKEASAWLSTVELKLPKLSPADLVAKAFAHYDQQFAPGQAKAEEIVVAFLRAQPPLELRTRIRENALHLQHAIEQHKKL